MRVVKGRTILQKSIHLLATNAYHTDGFPWNWTLDKHLKEKKRTTNSASWNTTLYFKFCCVFFAPLSLLQRSNHVPVVLEPLLRYLIVFFFSLSLLTVLFRSFHMEMAGMHGVGTHRINHCQAYGFRFSEMELTEFLFNLTPVQS